MGTFIIIALLSAFVLANIAKPYTSFAKKGAVLFSGYGNFLFTIVFLYLVIIITTAIII